MQGGILGALMKLDFEFQSVPEAGAKDSPDTSLLLKPDSEGRQPQFVDTFQQIIDGLPEQIALTDDQWTILAVNPAWSKTAALYGYHALTPGTDYLAYCEARAAEGHTPAAIVAKGIREMEQNGEPSFQFVYHGKDRWEGFAFQLCVKRMEVAGRTLHTVTRYDVTELVRLRQMREEFSHSLIEHQAEERRRMAREVHDSTMQLLASLGLSLGQIKRSKSLAARTNIVDEMEDLLGQIQRELRAVSFLAHPPMVSELGLAKALRQLAGGFGRRTGLHIEVEVDEAEPLPPAAEVVGLPLRSTTLSMREKEVLQLVVAGLGNRQVAEQLGISARTVEVHKSRVMGKLGARNLADLIRVAGRAR